MNIYKLTFKDHDEAELTLMAKYVIDIDSNYINGTQSVVYLGVIDELNPKYCVDIMITEDVDFGDNEIKPLNPKHNFAGHLINIETNEDIR
jgi:hypothetical protein